jgi:hypothetical protein
VRRLRIILIAATLFSLLLCLATLALWIRSYWRHDVRLTKFGPTQRSVELVRGALHVYRIDTAYAYPAADQGVHWYSAPVFPTDTIDGRYQARARAWQLAGFAVIEGDAREGMIYAGEPPIPYRAVVIPLWAIATPFAALAGFGAMRLRARRSRARQGLCPTCGYDCRATPDRCPECGANKGDSPPY